MKAQELRIGNKIQFDSHLYIVNSVVMKQVEEGFVQYQPIPLTEEWLLKFGFEKQGHVKFMGEAYQRFVLGRNGIYSINKIAYIYEVNDHDLCEIKYIHQLQNLHFALTGEELT